MAVSIATTIRRRAREVPQRRLAADLRTSRSRVARALAQVDDFAAVLAALGLEVRETP